MVCLSSVTIVFKKTKSSWLEVESRFPVGSSAKIKSGSVIINGKDISKLSPQDRVKEGISFVPQTKNVFAGMTVEENLEMGAFLINSDYKLVSDEIFDLFPILKEKKNQLVGELSGGQRQRLALARAFYRQSKLLVLDEATSALDNRTEAEVMEAIEIIGRRCTIVIIAHRISTVMKSDCIYEFQNGKVKFNID